MSKKNLLDTEIEGLKQQIAFKEKIEKALSSIAIQFIQPNNIENALNFALSKLLECSNADRAIVMQVNDDNSKFISMTHEKCKPGVGSKKRFTQNVLRFKNPWFQKTHEKFGYIAITDTNKLPSEAVDERKLFKQHTIGAALHASFTSKGIFKGNLALHYIDPIDEWKVEMIHLVIFTAVLVEHSLERANAEAKMLVQKEKAERSDKLKSAFLANLSHEIRTPLNGIIGFSKLLSTRKFAPDKHRQYVNLIDTNSKHLLNVINDLIDISRIESGNIRLNHKNFELHQLLIDIFELHKQILKSKPDIQLALVLPETKKNLLLNSDPYRIRQIIDNLLKNAGKFTEYGKIILGYTLKNEHLEIFVEDTGIGIHPEDQDRVFDRFWQVNSTEVRQFGGSGLGLSISRDFARLLNGDLLLKSRPGKGSRFSLIIQLAKEDLTYKQPLRLKAIT